MKRTKTSKTAAKAPSAEPLPTPEQEPEEIQDELAPDEGQKVLPPAADKALLKEQRRPGGRGGHG